MKVMRARETQSHRQEAEPPTRSRATEENKREQEGHSKSMLKTEIT